MSRIVSLTLERAQGDHRVPEGRNERDQHEDELNHEGHVLLPVVDDFRRPSIPQGADGRHRWTRRHATDDALLDPTGRALRARGITSTWTLLEVLAAALEHWPGALVVATHDRRPSRGLRRDRQDRL
jgi:hypothetical protein